MKNERIIYLYIPIIILLYLLVNLILIKTGSTICQSNGCEATKSLLSIDTNLLYSLGNLGAISLIITGFLYLKKELSNNLFKLILIGMFLFETVLLSYLILKTNEMCWICLGFYSLLVINLILLSLKEKEDLLKYLFFISIIFIAMFILDIRKQPNEIKNKYTIIGTESCKFCKETKEKLKELKVEFKEENYDNYKDTFKMLNIKSIPVLIIKEEDSWKIIEGKENIIKSIESKILYKTEDILNIMEIPLPEVKTEETLHNIEKKDGCNINLIYQEKKEDNSCSE
jgi:glutaredoxin